MGNIKITVESKKYETTEASGTMLAAVMCQADGQIYSNLQAEQATNDNALDVVIATLEHINEIYSMVDNTETKRRVEQLIASTLAVMMCEELEEGNVSDR